MNEDFVSFELAKKLKEKGYPQKPDNMNCMPYYEYDEVANYIALCNEIVWHMSTEPRDNIFAAPAIHKVLKWLREEKKQHIGVVLTTMDFYKPIICKCEIFGARIDNLPPRCSYEQAAIDGITYCLDNLI